MCKGGYQNFGHVAIANLNVIGKENRGGVRGLTLLLVQPCRDRVWGTLATKSLIFFLNFLLIFFQPNLKKKRVQFLQTSQGTFCKKNSSKVADTEIALILYQNSCNQPFECDGEVYFCSNHPKFLGTLWIWRKINNFKPLQIWKNMMK